MMDHSSPATRLHDVVVVHEQTRAEWRAAGGAIRNGRIVVQAGRSAPPEGLFTTRATYSVHATDGVERVRHFPHLTFSEADSTPPTEYVFD